VFRARCKRQGYSLPTESQLLILLLTASVYTVSKG
jgi:hypothetical protein